MDAGRKHKKSSSSEPSSSTIQFLPALAPPSKKPKSVLPASKIQIVAPGEAISTEVGFLRGHGTYVKGDKLHSTLGGVVERVNKLVSVRPLRSRYQPEVGDVIIGRVRELAAKRWKLDINSRLDGILMLSAINLPGGAQRRRTQSDELQMRSFFQENDLISAEVQQFFSDGAIALHTRSLKYGKLEQGQFVAVPPALIKRGKTAFNVLPCGVEVILGANGYIWISPPTSPATPEEEHSMTARVKQEITLEMRQRISRVLNAIEALRMNFIAIYPGSISDTYDESLRHNIAVKDMVTPTNAEFLTQRAKERLVESSLSMH
jgi:exosome complex component RRP4